MPVPYEWREKRWLKILYIKKFIYIFEILNFKFFYKNTISIITIVLISGDDTYWQWNCDEKKINGWNINTLNKLYVGSKGANMIFMDGTTVIIMFLFYFRKNGHVKKL